MTSGAITRTSGASSSGGSVAPGLLSTSRISSGGRVCPTRLPIYDGESRLDLVLSSSGTKPFKTNGFSGDAVVCKARYVPKSGYRQGRKDIEYLKSISMEIWFAKSNNMDVYAPVYAIIPTRVGQVYITATKYGG